MASISYFFFFFFFLSFKRKNGVEFREGGLNIYSPHSATAAPNYPSRSPNHSFSSPVSSTGRFRGEALFTCFTPVCCACMSCDSAAFHQCHFPFHGKTSIVIPKSIIASISWASYFLVKLFEVPGRHHQKLAGCLVQRSGRLVLQRGRNPTRPPSPPTFWALPSPYPTPGT